MRTTIIGLCLVLGACAGNRKDVLDAHNAGKGTEQVFDAPLDQAWDASRAALRWNNAQAIEEHRDQGYMIGTAPMQGFSNGASIGVWLSPAGDASTRVRVIVSRAYALNWTGQTESGVLEDMGKAVTLEKAGKPLPEQSP
jgi:hypothetical protein